MLRRRIDSRWHWEWTITSPRLRVRLDRPEMGRSRRGRLSGCPYLYLGFPKQLAFAVAVNFWHSDDIVRVIGRKLVDRTSSRPSRCELTPFRESGSAVLLEDGAGFEVTVQVEVVVD